jgi:hypothetical protein
MWPKASVLLAAIITVVLAVPAAAVPPVTQTIHFSDVIEGHVDACNLNLRWDVSGTVERTTFLDDAGNVVRFQDRVRESNTVTNLDTGETLQEGPDSFQQRILFNDDGIVTVEINGLSVLVNGGERTVVDAGRVVLLLGPSGPTVLDVSGRHDVRGIDPTVVDDPILLEGFCEAFT